RALCLHVEVSSLNRPDYEHWNMMFMNHIFNSTFRNQMIGGGYLVAARKRSTLEEAIRQVDEAVFRVKQTGKTEKFNIPGVATIYLALESKSKELPEDCRGRYRTTGPPSHPLQEQIVRKIEEKSGQVS